MTTPRDGATTITLLHVLFWMAEYALAPAVLVPVAALLAGLASG